MDATKEQVEERIAAKRAYYEQLQQARASEEAARQAATRLPRKPSLARQLEPGEVLENRKTELLSGDVTASAVPNVLDQVSQAALQADLLAAYRAVLAADLAADARKALARSRREAKAAEEEAAGQRDMTERLEQKARAALAEAVRLKEGTDKRREADAEAQRAAMLAAEQRANEQRAVNAVARAKRKVANLEGILAILQDVEVPKLDTLRRALSLAEGGEK